MLSGGRVTLVAGRNGSWLGSAAGYYFQPGTNTSAWVIWLQVTGVDSVGFAHLLVNYQARLTAMAYSHAWVFKERTLSDRFYREDTIYSRCKPTLWG